MPKKKANQIKTTKKSQNQQSYDKILNNPYFKAAEHNYAFSSQLCIFIYICLYVCVYLVPILQKPTIEPVITNM